MMGQMYGGTLRTWLSIFRIRMMEGFQYRIAALSGATVGTFWGLIEITVLSVFYHHSASPHAGIAAGLSLPQVVTYVWLAQVLFTMQFHGVDGEIGKKIISGDIGVELCRPMHLYSHWFAKTAAGKVAPSFMRGIPILLISLLMPVSYRLIPPASFAGLMCTVLTGISAFILCSAYGMLATSMRMNIPWGDGPIYMMVVLAGVLSGAYLPLRLWPDWMQTFLRYQPFAGYLDYPIQFYLGTMAPREVGWALMMQSLWALTFILLGKWVMDRQLRTVIVQGG